MDDKGMVGPRDLYVEATCNLRFIKGQQWTLAYYAVVLYAALYWAHGKIRSLVSFLIVPGPVLVDVIVTFSAIVALATGLGIVYSYQRWVQKERQRLNRLYARHADKRFLDANREWGGNQFINYGLWRDWPIWLALASVQVVAFVWLAAIIWVPYLG